MRQRHPTAKSRTNSSDSHSTASNTPGERNAAALRDAVLNCPNLAVIVTDQNGLIQSFNVGAERMLGYMAKEAVRKLSAGDFYDPLGSVERARALGGKLGRSSGTRFAALTAKAARAVEDKADVTLVRRDGSRFPALVTIMALRDEQDCIMGYMLIGSDISALKAAAEANAVKLLQAEVVNYHSELERERNADLKDSQELFRQIATNIPEALWIRDTGSKTLRYINPIWEEMTGRAATAGDDMHKLYEAFHPDDVQRVLRAVRDFPNGGATLECRIARPDGAVRWVYVRTFPIADSEGKIYRVAGFMDDITERKQESERIERLKDEFVSTVSHELRTPLTSIAGSLGLLVGNAAGALPEPAARLLSIAHTNSQRLVRLINDILDIEKIESGKVVYDLERIEIGSLVQQSIEAVRGFAQAYGVRIRFDKASVDGEVCADRDRLIQVFTNLLSNAVKFSPRGKEVVVAIERRGNTLKASVRDHGPGIPTEFKARIFEKFAQADNTDARQKGGSGLGLSIAQQIIVRLGGEVGFEDAPGGGTIFHVRLPDWDYLSKTKTAIDGRADGARVLLCEDDPDVAIVLCERLWQAGFATDVAYTAGAAVKHAAAKGYAAILLDMHNPEGDGITLIKQLRSQPKCANTLLIVASADPDKASESARPAAMLNIQDWLDKPVSIDRIVRVFSRLIVPGTNTRARILHVDDDPEMLRLVAQVLNASADVMAAQSVEEARRALATQRFDVAVLNVTLAEGLGLDLLMELRDREGDALPVIVFSSRNENGRFGARLRASLTKSQIPVDSLVETLRRHLAGRPLRAADDKDAA